VERARFTSPIRPKSTTQEYAPMKGGESNARLAAVRMKVFPGSG